MSSGVAQTCLKDPEVGRLIPYALHSLLLAYFYRVFIVPCFEDAIMKNYLRESV
jgi:hypothetical protein